MKKSLLQQLLLYEYRYLVGFVVLISLSLYAMFWRLGTLLPGLNRAEIDQATLSTDLSTLMDNPIDPVYRLLQWLSFQISPDPIIATRLAGAIFGLGCIYLMYKVLTLKFSARIALVSSIVFAMSSWLLSYARFGHSAIATAFFIIALIYFAYRAYEKRSLFRFAWVIGVAGLGIYHRWFIYFVILGAIISFPVIRDIANKMNRKTKLSIVGISAVIVAPLLVAVVRDPEIARTLLNLPASLPSLSEAFDNAQTALAHVFWQSDPFPALHLGSVPMLDVFSAAMVALGLYHLDHEISKTLSRFVLMGFGLSILILTLNPDPFAFAILIPFVYILLAAGFIMLVGQWNEIFPKNPIARSAAFIPLAILVLSVVAYHNERYFLAWPRTPDVIRQYPEAIGSLNAFVKDSGENVIVIGTPEEASTYEIVTRTYSDVQYVSTNQSVEVLSANTAIVTPSADSALNKNLRDQLPPIKRLLSSSSSLESTLFIVYSRE